MRTFFLMLCCMFSAAAVHAEHVCNRDSIPASTPDSQLIDNGDNTVTDSKTGLMWKRCIEGVDGDNCEIGSPSLFTWQQALQQPGTINAGGGFAGHSDWRLPNIRELRSLVEEQCYDPAINLNRFPGTPSREFLSGSPSADNSSGAWYVHFMRGLSYFGNRDSSSYAMRLVRDGQ